MRALGFVRVDTNDRFFAELLAVRLVENGTKRLFFARKGEIPARYCAFILKVEGVCPTPLKPFFAERPGSVPDFRLKITIYVCTWPNCQSKLQIYRPTAPDKESGFSRVETATPELKIAAETRNSALFHVRALFSTSDRTKGSPFSKRARFCSCAPRAVGGKQTPARINISARAGQNKHSIIRDRSRR